MIFSRFFTALCIGILIPSLFAMLIKLFPAINNLITAGLCLVLTYGISGYISVWAAKEYAYMMATLTGTLICVFQYSYTIVWIAGDLIFTPEIFAISLLMGITMSIVGAWLHLKRDKERNQPISV